jgi:hypothetical protein
LRESDMPGRGGRASDVDSGRRGHKVGHSVRKSDSRISVKDQSGNGSGPRSRGAQDSRRHTRYGTAWIKSKLPARNHLD